MGPGGGAAGITSRRCEVLLFMAPEGAIRQRDISPVLGTLYIKSMNDQYLNVELDLYLIRFHNVLTVNETEKRNEHRKKHGIRLCRSRLCRRHHGERVRSARRAAESLRPLGHRREGAGL